MCLLQVDKDQMTAGLFTILVIIITEQNLITN